MSSPIQKILFGSPGTGKSYKISQISKQELGIQWNNALIPPENVIRIIFHPDYTNSDFIGKLLPKTNEKGDILYKYYEGHFLQALGLAYKYLKESNQSNVILVIDELNRGNAAAIFGIIFQLLDRDSNGWSNYPINISELEFDKVLKKMGYSTRNDSDYEIEIKNDKQHMIYLDFFNKKAEESQNENQKKLFNLLQQRSIALPPNLSIVATINTSDESIYYLDSAFKRRWDWEHIEAPGKETDITSLPEEIKNSYIYLPETETKYSWVNIVIGFNELIKLHHEKIRNIEDKQIGTWFLKPDDEEDPKIPINKVRDKLMFYLWDTVFPRNKKPLSELLYEQTQKEVNLITYSDFINYDIELLEYLEQLGKQDQYLTEEDTLDDDDEF